jgi:hypothetical protein
MITRSWIRSLLARTPSTIRREPARDPAAPLLGPTNMTHTDEASDASEGFIDGAGI